MEPMSTVRDGKKSFSKDDVQRILRHDDPRVDFEDHATDSRVKNEEYRRFKRVRIDKKTTDFLICEDCNDKKLIRQPKGAGTQLLITHVSKFHKSSAQPKSKQQRINMYATQTVGQRDMMKIADKAAIFCAKDLRPFTIVEGQGFIDLVQSVVTLCCSKGLMKVEDLLPTADTVRNHLKDLDGTIKDALIEKLQGIDYVSATSDHWVDKYVNQSYMTVTIQYYDPFEKVIMSRILGTFGVDDKTALTTRNHFDEMMSTFKINAKLKIVVTDNGSSMVAAFKDLLWIPCAAHNLSLVHSYAYGNLIVGDPIPRITSLIEECKSLVRHVKKSGINKQLGSRLKQEVETRWDSHYDMLQSVLINYDSLKAITSLKSRMDKIYQGLLSELVSFLEPIMELRKDLCKDTDITFNLVAIDFDKIIKLCSKDVVENESMIVLKSRFKLYMKQKFVVTKYHVIASFLTPGMRKFMAEKFPDKHLFAESMKLIKILLEEEVPESENEDGVEDDDLERSLYAEYYDKPVKNAASQSELDSYLKYELSASDRQVNPIQFWMDNKQNYPHLSNIAIWLLSAPASNVSSERSFSDTGNIITPHRNCLSPETVQYLTFVRSNDDLLSKK